MKRSLVDSGDDVTTGTGAAASGDDVTTETGAASVGCSADTVSSMFSSRVLCLMP